MAEPRYDADEVMMDALLHERDGYEARGNTDRVKQVDAALKELGVDSKKRTALADQRSKRTAVNADAEAAASPEPPADRQAPEPE